MILQSLSKHAQHAFSLRGRDPPATRTRAGDRPPAAIYISDHAIELFTANVFGVATFERIVVKNVLARGKLLERERSFADVFAVAGRTHLDLVAPVLAAVVIGVEKVQAHHVGEDGEAPPTYVERTFRR